jgi:hypothetical protein
MNVDKVKLKELAEAAAAIEDEHEWYAEGGGYGLYPTDLKFIAAAKPAAVLALLAEIDRLKADLAISNAIKEPAGEDVLFQVLDATVGIITRRAYPHALESEAWNAGLKVITDRRAGLVATADLEPKKTGD